jgi:glycosyltransferase involved in cell wall biosynthesis
MKYEGQGTIYHSKLKLLFLMDINMRILIHDFSGHPFQVQLSRSLARRGFTVLHVYSKSYQTPKGKTNKENDDSQNFDVIGISQEKPFPKYSLIKRWFVEKDYAKNLLKIANDFKPEIVISGNTPLDIQMIFYTQCKIQNIRFIFWVQDIYSVAINQLLKKKLAVIREFVSIYYKNLEIFLLNNSDHIVVISDDFKQVIREWTKNKNITVIENWAPLDEMQPKPKKNHWSISNGISDKFCFLYSGTLGMKHNPDILLQLAKQYKNNDDTVIVIISEGIGIEWLKSEVNNEKIKNVLFFKYLDFKLFPFALSSADVLIAILKKDAGIYSVPSKVLTYHCIGKPLLLSVPKENLASRIVKNHTSGIVTNSGDVDAFCRSAEKLKKDEKLRIELGRNARIYASDAFNIDTICESFIGVFK